MQEQEFHQRLKGPAAALPIWAQQLPSAQLAAYRAVLERLYALGPGRMLSGRERLEQLLARCGDPHLAVPAVLIGGTNGKGRLAAALSAVLSARYRTGAFLKPHLKSIRERWRLNDETLSVPGFIEAAQECMDAVDAFSAGTGQAISFFEANVLLGALLFRSSGCEIAVWEVGLGGREDACNLVEPLVSALTNVQYDHQAILGDSLEEIALDKAGIARPGRPLLLGPPRHGWEADYARYAATIRGEAQRIGADFSPVAAQGGAELRALNIELPADSAALLEALLARLAAAGFALTPEQCAAGLRRMHYRGRLELCSLAGRPVLLDAAHNTDSMRWLGLRLSEQMLSDDPQERRGFPIAFGCQSSRDPREMLAAIAPACASLTPLCVPVLHPAPLDSIVEAAKSLGLRIEQSAGLAAGPLPGDLPIGHNTELDAPDFAGGWIESLQHALELATPGRPLVICGSIYYIGEILRAFEDGWLPAA